MCKSPARSAASTPAPPPLVIIPRRFPADRWFDDRIYAAAKSCPNVPTRTAPALSKAASKTASDPINAPVCVCAASEPRLWRPALRTITGLIVAAARNELMKDRASRIPSTYSKIASVFGSVDRKCRTSPKSMLVELPSETIEEKPSPCGPAQSEIAEQSAPDCETTERRPFGAAEFRNVAFMPIHGLTNPTQFGPMKRMRLRRATSNNSAVSASPFGPTSPKPAEMTMAFLIPTSPHY